MIIRNLLEYFISLKIGIFLLLIVLTNRNKFSTAISIDNGLVDSEFIKCTHIFF